MAPAMKVSAQAGCGLTLRSSGRVLDKVPSPIVGVRAAQLNRYTAMLRSTRTLFSVLCGLAHIGASFACSPTPSVANAPKPATPTYLHEFVAVTVADPSNRPSDGRTREWPATLKVLESKSGDPAVGSTLTMRRIIGPGADCGRKTVDLTLYDYSEGTKLRIKAYGLELAEEVEYAH